VPPYVDGLGALTQHPDVPEWLISAPTSVQFFPSKELQFIFDEGLSEFEVSPDAVDAAKNFMALRESNRVNTWSAVYRNYQEFVQATGHGRLAINKPEDIWNFCGPTRNPC
jgi:hypothetical protein